MRYLHGTHPGRLLGVGVAGGVGQGRGSRYRGSAVIHVPLTGHVGSDLRPCGVAGDPFVPRSACGRRGRLQQPPKGSSVHGGILPALLLLAFRGQPRPEGRLFRLPARSYPVDLRRERPSGPRPRVSRSGEGDPPAVGRTRDGPPESMPPHPARAPVQPNCLPTCARGGGVAWIPHRGQEWY